MDQFTFKGDAIYITEPLSSFRLHTGQQVHHKYLEGCEDFSHLVLHSKNMVFYKIADYYKTSLLKACEWYKKRYTTFYQLYPELIPTTDTHTRLSHCLNIVTKELHAI